MVVLSPAPPRAIRRDEIANILRNAILDGTLPMGFPLVEVQIARQLRTSRAPLREALRQLEHEGLVVTVRHRGTTVVTLSEEDIEEIFSLRAALEAFAVRRAFERGNVEALVADLASRIEQMASHVAAGDVRNAQEEDFAFHEAIIRAPCHSRLLRVWATMLGQLRLAFRAFHKHPEYPGFANLADRHRSILAAVQSGDLARAEATIVEHIIGPGNGLMWSIRMRTLAVESPVPGMGSQLHRPSAEGAEGTAHPAGD